MPGPMYGLIMGPPDRSSPPLSYTRSRRPWRKVPKIPGRPSIYTIRFQHQSRAKRFARLDALRRSWNHRLSTGRFPKLPQYYAYGFNRALFLQARALD